MSYISISLLSSNLCYLCCFTSSWAVKNVLGAAVREVLNCPKGTPPYNSHWVITWRVSQSHRSRKPPAATKISLDYTWLDQGIWSAWWKVYIKDRWQYNRAIFELLLLSWVKSSNHIELCQDMSRHLKIRWAHVGTTWHHLWQFIGTKSSFIGQFYAWTFKSTCPIRSQQMILPSARMAAKPSLAPEMICTLLSSPFKRFVLAPTVALTERSEGSWKKLVETRRCSLNRIQFRCWWRQFTHLRLPHPQVGLCQGTIVLVAPADDRPITTQRQKGAVGGGDVTNVQQLILYTASIWNFTPTSKQQMPMGSNGYPKVGGLNSWSVN